MNVIWYKGERTIIVREKGELFCPFAYTLDERTINRDNVTAKYHNVAHIYSKGPKRTLLDVIPSKKVSPVRSIMTREFLMSDLLLFSLPEQTLAETYVKGDKENSISIPGVPHQSYFIYTHTYISSRSQNENESRFSSLCCSTHSSVSLAELVSERRWGRAN